MNNIIIRRVKMQVALLLFFLMIVFPFEFIFIKITIILLVIGISLLDNVTFQLYTVKWFALLILWGVSFILLGAIYETDGAYSLIGVYVIWPFVYLYFIANIKSIKVFYKLVQIALVSSVFISGYLILYVLSLKSNFIDPGFFSMAKLVVTEGSSRIEVFVPSATSLLFIVPLNIALLFSDSKAIFSKKYLLIILLFNLVSVLIIHRNMLYLLVVLSPFIALIINKIITREYITNKVQKSLVFKIPILLMVLVSLILIFSKELFVVLESIKYGFQFTTEDAISAHARYVQFFELIQGWKSKPYFGNGLGATLDSYSRSKATPWMFELSYLALLYNVGIVGLCIYFFIIIAMIRKSLMVAREDANYTFIVTAILTATISFLIANATNPYLYSYEHMWAYFAPLGIVNGYLYAKNRAINA